MISLMCCNSHFRIPTLFFYTCVWIPYLELKKAFDMMLGFVFPWCRAEENGCQETNVCLPVARFEDLKLSNGSRGSTNREVEEACSICLVELEKEDVVSQLQKCGHVFHMKCIETWVERDQFTSPLCRSFLFDNINSCHAKCGTDNLHTTSQLVPSWLSF